MQRRPGDIWLIVPVCEVVTTLNSWLGDTVMELPVLQASGTSPPEASVRMEDGWQCHNSFPCADSHSGKQFASWPLCNRLCFLQIQYHSLEEGNNITILPNTILLVSAMDLFTDFFKFLSYLQFHFNPSVFEDASHMTLWTFLLLTSHRIFF